MQPQAIFPVIASFRNPDSIRTYSSIHDGYKMADPETVNESTNLSDYHGKSSEHEKRQKTRTQFVRKLK